MQYYQFFSLFLDIEDDLHAYIRQLEYTQKVSEILELIEHQKWELYSHHCILDDFTLDKPKSDLPESFYPRRVGGREKTFELNSSRLIDNEIRSLKLGGKNNSC